MRAHAFAPRPPLSLPFVTLPPSPCRKQSFYEAEPRALRAQLRAGYEALLFLDAAFAAANDAEHALWKSVYYRPIEEFRARMRRAEKARGGARGRLHDTPRTRRARQGLRRRPAKATRRMAGGGHGSSGG
jgi:hypothetical protein